MYSNENIVCKMAPLSPDDVCEKNSNAYTSYSSALPIVPFWYGINVRKMPKYKREANHNLWYE